MCVNCPTTSVAGKLYIHAKLPESMMQAKAFILDFNCFLFFATVYMAQVGDK